MHYIDSSTGKTYPLDTARWCGDGGAHLNLGDAPGLTRRHQYVETLGVALRQSAARR